MSEGIFFCQGTFSGKTVLTSGSLELMKEQLLAALSSCHVVGVTQEDASRIGRCKGAPIRSGVCSELATELLPASPGRLIKFQNRCVEWSRMDTALRAGPTVPPLYLHEVQRYHPCTCTKYNGHLARCDFRKKKNRISQAYHLQVQGWYCSTS